MSNRVVKKGIKGSSQPSKPAGLSPNKGGAAQKGSAYRKGVDSLNRRSVAPTGSGINCRENPCLRKHALADQTILKYNENDPQKKAGMSTL